MNPFTSPWGLLAVALALIALCGALVLVLVPAPHPLEGGIVMNASSTPTTSGGDEPATTTPAATSTPASENLSDFIVVTSPKSGATIGTSSLTIAGKARGSFYFEASFPVTLVDAKGTVLAQGHAQAQGDWMTSDFVPFTATLTYAEPAGTNKRGTLILHNDNPSGDLARSKTLEIPVVFP